MSSHLKAKDGGDAHFGEWLRGLREATGLTLREVAAGADLDMTHLSKIELGQRLATEEQTTNLAKFFHVNGTEAQARRMVEKFRHDSEANPAAAKEAVAILAERAGLYPTPKRKG